MHPLDLLALAAGIKITILERSIWIDFPRIPDADLIAELTQLFDRPGYKFNRGINDLGIGGNGEYANRYCITTHPGIDIGAVIKIVTPILEYHGINYQIEYAASGKRWQYAQ
jgi:hypothetical protein